MCCSDGFGLTLDDSQDEDSEDNDSGLSWTKAIEAHDGTRTEKEGKATLTHTGGAGDSGGGLGGGGLDGTDPLLDTRIPLAESSPTNSVSSSSSSSSFSSSATLEATLLTNMGAGGTGVEANVVSSQVITTSALAANVTTSVNVSASLSGSTQQAVLVVTDELHRPDIASVLVETDVTNSSATFTGCSLSVDSITNDWRHPREYKSITESGKANQEKGNLYYRNDGSVTNILPLIHPAKSKKMGESTITMKVSYRNFHKYKSSQSMFPKSLTFTVATFTIEFSSSNVLTCEIAS